MPEPTTLQQNRSATTSSDAEFAEFGYQLTS